MEKLKSYFKIGYISKVSSNSYYYGVSSISDLNDVIISHFLNYPLLTNKQADFKLFKEALNLMNCGEHLTSEGLAKIINIKASMYKGLSKELQDAFPNAAPVLIPTIDTFANIEPN